MGSEMCIRDRPKGITHANERNEEREMKAETAKHNEIKKKRKRKGHRMQKNFAGKRGLMTAYCSHVLSLLEYCGPLFFGLDVSNSTKLEKIRRRCHFMVAGASCKCNSFERLEDRRWKQSLQI